MDDNDIVYISHTIVLIGDWRDRLEIVRRIEHIEAEDFYSEARYYKDLNVTKITFALKRSS